MAQPTLADLRERTRNYLTETIPESSFWSVTFLDQLINGAYMRRCSQLIMAFEGWFTNVAVRDLVANKDRYAFPDGFQRLSKIELVRSDGRTVPIQRNERHAQVNHSETGAIDDQYTPFYRPVGNGFVLEPMPLSTVTQGVRIHYEGKPETLSDAADQLHPSFPDLFDELLVLDSAVMAFDAEGAQESGQVQTILRLREEYEFDFRRFIDQRVVSRTSVEPFVAHYEDA